MIFSSEFKLGMFTYIYNLLVEQGSTISNAPRWLQYIYIYIIKQGLTMEAHLMYTGGYK